MVSIIAGASRASQVKTVNRKELPAKDGERVRGLWQTRPMLECVDAYFSDGPSLRISTAADAIRSISFDVSAPAKGATNRDHPLLREAVRQLRAYFAGDLREFDLPLDLQGTDFQVRVWEHLLTIPYGETRSYMSVAEAIGASRAVRAVGAANGANPIAIVVPCHRVIGASGKLVGYGGGLALKKKLIALESGASNLFVAAE